MPAALPPPPRFTGPRLGRAVPGAPCSLPSQASGLQVPSPAALSLSGPLTQGRFCS